MIDENEEEFLARNERMQQIIDRLADHERSELDEHGKKAEIAREFDVVQSHVHYVLDNWGHLVEWRRAANRDPLDPDAVKSAYEDDTLRAMAANKPIPDGAGNVTIPIELELDEAFRAMKLLPGDLGLKVYTQVLQRSRDLPENFGEIMRAAQDDE